MTESKNSRPVRRATPEEYRGSQMCIEVGPDGVFVWPRNRRQRVMISLVSAYESALAHEAGFSTKPHREIGMSARRYSK